MDSRKEKEKKDPLSYDIKGWKDWDMWLNSI